MKKKTALLISLILFAGIAFYLAYYAGKSKPAFSYIDKQVSEYMKTGQWTEESILSSFPDNSAEAFFSKGMKCYADNQIEEAQQYFNTAEKKVSSDAALPIYLNIYLNECSIKKTGSGNITYVKKALDEITEYSGLTNPPYWVWHLVYPITEDKDAAVSSVDLLQEYIDEAKWLKEDEILQMESYLAILKNINEEYSESILLFYNILDKAQDMPNSHPIIKTKSVCINYIADMYYSYDDYDRANDLYLELLAQTIDDPYENAKLKYTAYVNAASIYLKQKDYENAKKMAAETETILPYLDKNDAAEIKAFLSNILANAELEQGNLSTAMTYFQKCEDFLRTGKSNAFFDTEVYFKLTQCKILQQSGDLEQAETILIQLLDNPIVEAKMRYEVRELLTDIYRLSGQDAEYFRARELLLEEQNNRVKQYQADYCEVISYYEQLVSLRKEHNISIKQNEVLAVVLFIALILLLVIIKLSLSRYRDSMTDTLSGLYNRKQLEKEVSFYDKNNHKLLSYGIIMADIDFFKKYNDTYGHAAGDEVIRRVSSILRQSVREKDIVIRYGGEEFLVLLKDINSSTIESIAERIRLNVAKEQICHENSACGEYLSLSVGCFYVENTASISLSDAIKEADKALYKSKQNGRNTVTLL